VDSSVLVAALMVGHVHHDAAWNLLAPAIETDSIILASRVLTESYSVLTRIPSPKRLPPERAWALLAENLRSHATLVDGGGDTHWSTLEMLASQGIRGGAVYDGEIAYAASRAGATRLLTLNVRHFLRVAPPGLEIVGPASA